MTRLAVIRTIALRHGIRLGHVLPMLGLAVPAVARTVIHLGTRIDPYLAGSATRSRCRRGLGRRSWGRRRCWRSRGRLSRWSGLRGTRWRWSPGRACRRRRRRRSRRAVPGLYSLVSAAGTAFRRPRPVASIPAKARASRGSVGWRLRKGAARDQPCGQDQYGPRYSRHRCSPWLQAPRSPAVPMLQPFEHHVAPFGTASAFLRSASAIRMLA
jgi:hypothetical protein